MEKKASLVFLGGSMLKNPSASAGDSGLIPDLGRSHMPWDWACALEPGSQDYLAHVLPPLKPTHPRACAPQQEKPLE